MNPLPVSPSTRSKAGSITPTRRWLRVRAAAAHLDVGVGTMNKLRIYGGGPPYSKLGAIVVYDVADLDRWAEERKVSSTSQCSNPASAA